MGMIGLSDKDRRMLDGRHGEAARTAMAILVRMADVLDAAELMDITQVHIDGCGLLSEASLDFAETMAARGGKVCVPTTLNMGPLDLQNWRRFGVPESFARRAIRQGKAYTDMGCVPTWSCAPYQGYLTPRFGQQICWGESNAIVYANSVLGARTNRYADYLDLCAAITGRVPKQGLHVTENRKGQVLVRLAGVAPEVLHDDAFYPVLGHLLGSLLQDEIPVIEGLPPGVADDQLKAFGAAAASSGALALFHAVGVTPEASTAEAAFQGDPPRRVLEIGLADVRAARADLSTAAEGEKLDVVALGCPHYSFAEFRRLAEQIQAQRPRRLHPDVMFLVTTCQTSYALLQRAEWKDVLSAFGARIALDTCPFHSPIVAARAEVLMTDSGKCAYYAPGELGVRVAFATVADCVRSAVEGRVCRKEPPWDAS
ncbi:MAG: aconitase X catalytic domain-containing protein [Planctomycetes bacterium]|nr:aconitase X catalytic domain-containing protein [Planctomycetota bacterium]